MSLRLPAAGACVLALALSACNSSQPPAAAAAVRAAPVDRYAMANACFALREAAGPGHLRVAGSAISSVQRLDEATALFMKPTALGKYLFYTPDRRFLALAGDGSVSVADVPSDSVEWTIDQVTGGFSILSSTSAATAFTAAGLQAPFQFVPVSGCTDYPEAQLNASGTPFKGRNADGTVFGYAETHMHLGGSEALGGRLGYGRPFHKFGITHALADCSGDHGPNGTLDALDAIVNPSRQFMPPHATQGWPTFADWPSQGSQTHHQTYYIWLKRAWMGGLRLMMNHLVANEVICQIWPLKEHSCNEMDSIALQRQLVLDLQDYIDAQEGGPGKGFFRITYSSAEARRTIENGQMAVVLGTENEKIFDCGEFLDLPECTREHIDAQLDEWHALGLRAIFPIHLFDNALGGSRLTDDPALSVVYQGGNILDTGHAYATIPCEEADGTPPGEAPVQSRGIIDTVLLQATSLPPAPPLTGCVKNARGLTELGDHFVKGMIDRGIMIETDHSGTLARKRMLDLALERDVPVLSGHTGFINEDRDSRRILEVGGVISNLPDEPAPVTVDFILRLAALYRELHGSTDGLGTGLGSDINGIHVQAAPRDDAAERPLVYPFMSYAGDVRFERQVTGERVFDLNTDGVAHYGLYPDFIADMQASEGGEEALKYLFRSAEVYLQAWERAERAAIKP